MAVDRAVVTGGAGFVGSAVVEALAGRGTSVLVVDDLSTGTASNLDRLAGAVELFKHDIRDAGPLRDAFTAFRPDLVFHLAARTDVRASMSDPHDDASVNVLGSINVFSAATAVGARRVVNTSTGGAIYAPTAPLPTSETAPIAPLSAYGLSKRVVEEYAEWFRISFGLDVVTLRYGNVYGPRQDPNGEAGVIAIFCAKFLRKQGIRIDWDGEQTRDYVFVKDIAQLNLAALEKGGGGRYAIGTGKRTSVNEIYGALVEISGFEAPVTPGPKRAGDARDAEFDSALAKKDLGWTATTSLQDGMRQTYEYFAGVLQAKA